MSRTILRNGTVFTAVADAAPAIADVAVVDDRISEIGPSLPVGADDEVIDCGGKLITPGLIDCHVHFLADGDFSPSTHAATPFSLQFFQAAERMRRTLACGITSVREAGGADLGVKEAQQLGLAPGPRMQISITILSQTGGHADSWEVCGAHVPGMLDEHPGRPHCVVDGPEEMRLRVREIIRAGADVLKVCTSGGVISPRDDPQHAHFRKEELDMLVAEAEAAHLFVMAHAQATEGIKNAVRAGIRSIEHGIYLDDEAIEMMLEAGTFLVPTLIAPQGVLDAAERGANVPAYALEKAAQVIDVHRQSVARAIEAGVKVAMGTDSGVTPHGQNLNELAQMASLGMSDPDVWRASTSVAADLLGVDHELGTVEVGKLADLVVWSGTELDVSRLRDRVELVVQDGAIVA